MFEAPEQLRGKPADARSDVYSLTATMHFAVQYAQADLRDPDHFDADKAPKPLRSVLVGGMETNPQRRFADGAGLAEAMIEPVVLEVPAPPPAMPEFVAVSSAKVRKAKPPVGSRAGNQQGVIIAAIGAALVVMVLVGLLLFWNSGQQPKPVAVALTPKSVAPATASPIAKAEPIKSEPLKSPTMPMVEPKISETLKSPTTSKVEPKRPEPTKSSTIPQVAAPSKTRAFDLGKGVNLEMVLIPAGTFMMGSPDSESNRRDDEVQHEVTISKPFYMGKYEITQAQWKQVMENNFVNHQETNFMPVNNISYTNVQDFCIKLKAITKAPFGLPTEAQWEYACRAGATTVFHFGNELNGTQANCDGSLPYGGSKGPNLGKITRVGTYPPNAWGLHDMHGNVLEWCSDWYGEYRSEYIRDPEGDIRGESRIRRGGCWCDDAWHSRTALRSPIHPGFLDHRCGGRVFLPLDF